MGKYKSFEQILKSQVDIIKKQQIQAADTFLEISIAYPPVLELLPLMLDYEGLVKDKRLTGEEKIFVYGIRAIDMVIHTTAFSDTAAIMAIINLFDVHLLPRLDTPYPDRYGMVVISLLEEATEKFDQFFKVYKEDTFTRRIDAVRFRMSY